MTVSSTASAVTYAANGSTTVWPFAFPILAESDAQVIITDASGLETVVSSAAYTITGIGAAAGGSITYPKTGTPIASGNRLTIRRNTAITQPVDLGPGAFYAEVHEGAFDRLTLVAQELKEQIDRTPKVPIGSGDDPDGLIAAIQSAAVSTAADAASTAARAAEAVNAAAAAAASAASIDFTLDPDPTLGTNSDVKVPSQKAVKAYVDTTASSALDPMRGQIALTNLRLMLNSAITSGALVQGHQWELASDEWSASTGQTWVAASPNYYTNMPTGYGRVATATPSLPYAPHAGVAANINDNNIGTTVEIRPGDLSGKPTSQRILGKLDFGEVIYLTKAEVKQFKLNWTPGVPSAWAYRFYTSTDGSTWAPFGSSSYNPSPQTATDYSVTGTVACRYLALVWLGDGQVSTSGAIYADINGYTDPSPVNMTLVSDVVSVASAPAYASAYALYHDDSGAAVLGTDLTAEISRDGGASWTAAAIAVLAAYDGTYALIRARAALAAQPVGTSLVARIKTLNLKAQRIAAPALYAE
ncbi:hypothetical protein [Magnetospirillum fulvum]|uniref:PRY3 protein n=1 Tax=Magnetospirillum fulvum MGU-K5 TaxID=1316936 RepID=S9TMH9_MAGFU|nr:hypothetical protein [Magnetospirillum fulvum]EPY03481.1 PRY3 protein [Magnetospirillum fulvum MGU-K5]